MDSSSAIRIPSFGRPRSVPPLHTCGSASGAENGALTCFLNPKQLLQVADLCFYCGSQDRQSIDPLRHRSRKDRFAPCRQLDRPCR